MAALSRRRTDHLRALQHSRGLIRFPIPEAAFVGRWEIIKVGNMEY